MKPVLQQNERIDLRLSAEDWKHFMQAIDNADKQRPKLEAAAHRYLKKKHQS